MANSILNKNLTVDQMLRIDEANRKFAAAQEKKAAEAKEAKIDSFTNSFKVDLTKVPSIIHEGMTKEEYFFAFDQFAKTAEGALKKTLNAFGYEANTVLKAFENQEGKKKYALKYPKHKATFMDIPEIVEHYIPILENKAQTKAEAKAAAFRKGGEEQVNILDALEKTFNDNLKEALKGSDGFGLATKDIPGGKERNEFYEQLLCYDPNGTYAEARKNLFNSQTAGKKLFDPEDPKSIRNIFGEPCKGEIREGSEFEDPEVYWEGFRLRLRNVFAYAIYWHFASFRPILKSNDYKIRYNGINCKAANEKFSKEYEESHGILCSDGVRRGGDYEELMAKAIQANPRMMSLMRAREFDPFRAEGSNSIGIRDFVKFCNDEIHEIPEWLEKKIKEGKAKDSHYAFALDQAKDRMARTLYPSWVAGLDTEWCAKCCECSEEEFELYCEQFADEETCWAQMVAENKVNSLDTTNRFWALHLNRFLGFHEWREIFTLDCADSDHAEAIMATSEEEGMNELKRIYFGVPEELRKLGELVDGKYNYDTLINAWLQIPGNYESLGGNILKDENACRQLATTEGMEICLADDKWGAVLTKVRDLMIKRAEEEAQKLINSGFKGDIVGTVEDQELVLFKAAMAEVKAIRKRLSDLSQIF